MSKWITNAFNKRKMQKKVLVSFILVLLSALMIVGNIYIYNTQPEIRVQKALNLGEKYLSELDYEKAVVYFNEVIAIDFTELSAYRGLVQVYAEQGDFQEVINQYSRADGKLSKEDKKILKTDILESMWVGGMQAVTIEDYSTAIFCYEEIFAMNVDGSDKSEIYEEAKRDLCYVYQIMAERAENQGIYDDAIASYNKILEIDAEHTEAKNRLGELHLIMSEEEKD